MSHPVYPTFPVSPTPGDTFTPATTTQVWTYVSDEFGWVKTVIERNDTHPAWPGRITNNINTGV
jgi:hypothetical protein